jgi:CRISPR-associated protein Csm5
MKYRLTCLTPTLIGDGQKLSPIDYMVWKDQVNVLDQRRIFRLLAKGPRLEGYLTQLRKADKLDFASWGGFAQNFADRRIPFEHPSLTSYWEKQRGETLFIPTFAAGPSGPYLPGTAVKGVLHTGLMFAHLQEGALRDVAAQFQGDRAPRRPAERAEDSIIGSAGYSRLRVVGVSDSSPVPVTTFKIFLLRTATLQARGAGKFELGWKQSPRGTVDARRVDDSTPAFCEMAVPGSEFEGYWKDYEVFARPEIARALRWREPLTRAGLFEAANAYAGRLLECHRKYAGMTGLGALDSGLQQLEGRLAEARESGGRACLLSLGWGSGLLSKVACLDTEGEAYRQILRQIPLFSRAIQTGLPFPKTRRVVFLNNQPAAIPGWSLLEVL